jgi:hypothetical protein
MIKLVGIFARIIIKSGGIVLVISFPTLQANNKPGNIDQIDAVNIIKPAFFRINRKK